MIDDLPDPPIPTEVDLRDFPYTPLFRSRLFGSEFHAEANDAEWRAGVTLWLKSWDQVPGGSLPDNDVALCRLAELGRDLKTWRKVKQVALHGWYKCSDGRLYHPVVAEGILEAWGRKEAERRRTAAARAARAAQRLLQTPQQSMSQRNVASVTDNLTDDTTEYVRDDATDSVTKSPASPPLLLPPHTPLITTSPTPPPGREGKGREGNHPLLLESESPTPARAMRAPPPSSSYAFRGQIIRLTQPDFDRWRSSYSAIPDLRAELETIDAKLVDENFTGRWFGRVSAWLRQRHEQLMRPTNHHQREEVDPNFIPESAEHWRARLTAWTMPDRGGPTRERWMDGAWGPPPGQPGCRAPPEILAEFGVPQFRAETGAT